MVNDAKRFILNNRSIIEKAPLQTYSSALVFSPKKSIIRTQFSTQFPAWIRRLPMVEESWNSSLQTLESHSDRVLSVAFSPDGKRLASGSVDCIVMLWDAETGAVQSMLKGHSNWVLSVAFSPDGKQLASGSSEHTVMLWDAETGAVQRTLKGCSDAKSYIQDSLYLLDGTGQWVTWKGHNVLFLPPDRRPTSYTIQDSILAIGHRSGSLTVLKIDPNINPLQL